MKRSQMLVLRALVCEQPPSENGVDHSWSTRKLAEFLNDAHGGAGVPEPFSVRAVRCSIEKFQRRGVVEYEGDNWHVDGRKALELARRYVHNPVFGGDARDVVAALEERVDDGDPLRMIFSLLGQHFPDERVARLREEVLSRGR